MSRKEREKKKGGGVHNMEYRIFYCLPQNFSIISATKERLLDVIQL